MRSMKFNHDQICVLDEIFTRARFFGNGSTCRNQFYISWKGNKQIYRIPLVPKNKKNGTCDAPRKVWQRRKWLPIVDDLVELVRKNPYSTSRNLAKFLDCSKIPFLGDYKTWGTRTSGQRGYHTICRPTTNRNYIESRIFCSPVNFDAPSLTE